MTTQSGLGTTHGTAVPLLGVEVRAEVVAGHAVATVRQRYRNLETNAVEATYTFPLPTRSVVTGFAMSVGDRRFEGEVKEKAAAFQCFDDAITAGHGAALLEQARPNVFTASVGNLLPGEETLIEIQYVEPLCADEGAVRWSIPTLVAPRYISAAVDVTDAEAVSPPIGDARYGLDLEVTFDLGAAVDVASPSHAIAVSETDGKTTVRLQQKDVALDRDVVVTACARAIANPATPIASSVCHRRRKDGQSDGHGTVAVMLVPDLGASKSEPATRPRHVVFLVDRSGSMGGTSMPEARTAMKLCLRQLREGDRFNVLAFDTQIEAFATEMVPYGPATLAKVDEWISRIDARGGTEILAPMLEAARMAPDGLVVLLTDGEVANEDQIVDAFMAARGTARVYSFGIGENVSDALLRELADRTGGAVQLIHPGERIDEKVTAQFSRATAARITDVTIKTRGISLGELAPTPSVLVDGEPTTVFATYEESGRGALEIRGKKDGESFYLEVAVDLEDESERPAIEKLWAQARIRELERASVGGRRAETMKERIVKLAQQYGVSSKHTSFVVIEKRAGERRMNEQPASRVVPVAMPAGWAMSMGSMGRPAATRAGSLRTPYPTPPPCAARSAPSLRAMAMPLGAPRPAAGMAPPAPIGAGRSATVDACAAAPPPPSSKPHADPVLAILSRQSASGLWEEGHRDPIELTVQAMLALVRLGLSSRHMIHGAQIKKAVDALLVRLAANRATDVRLREIALGVAWLLASGPRTRTEIEAAAKGSALAVTFGNEPAVRAHVERLAI
jgi:Ca-activated chloride channel family protein